MDRGPKTIPTRRGTIRDVFHRFAQRSATLVGSPGAFVIAITLVVGWACLGPRFGYSDTWQLVINTATTIITFLIVFLIQSTQNRDAAAIQLKLDELLRGVRGARTSLVALEGLSEEELDRLREEFQRLHERAREKEPGGLAP